MPDQTTPTATEQTRPGARGARPEGTRPRGRGVQTVLEVVGTEQLSPHLVRIHLGGEGFDAFIAGADTEKLAKTDKYVKMQFAKPELGLVPPYDLEALRETLDPDDMPVSRTYTIRSVDAAARSLAIDFVVHGDEGIAGPWAAGATAGDKISFSGPGAQFAPAEGDIEHLFFGDDSAIPAIDAALEALAPDARGLAIIEIGSAADEVTLSAPEGVDVRWLHRRGRGRERRRWRGRCRRRERRRWRGRCGLSRPRRTLRPATGRRGPRPSGADGAGRDLRAR
ncbi:siderophore-interacting protein [Microbacterium invictum]|uniref:NADPH-dependent ferric siderophore reductase n=1 Tax=Microbacterium invictum TaxID=515415 RepID=A0AA40SPS3_9MICO|nr:NADPH-dependent ferric siderophore reductase [Microbacterium invictum]